MDIYQIAEKKYIVLDGAIVELAPVHPFATAGEVIGIPVSNDVKAQHAPHFRRAKPLRKYVKGKGYKKGTCGKCGEEGHTAWTCPERKKKKPVQHEKIGGARPCKICHEFGHLSKTCPDRPAEAPESALAKPGDDGPLAGLDEPEEARVEKEVTREEVQALKAEGLDSLKVAARLRCRLSQVNEFWN